MTQQPRLDRIELQSASLSAELSWFVEGQQSTVSWKQITRTVRETHTYQEQEIEYPTARTE